MTPDADPRPRDALSPEWRRRTLSIPTSHGPAELAGIEFGDSHRPLDVIFLHANGFNALTYRSVLAPLSDRLRILAIDQQGHGHSPQRAETEGRLDWLDFRDDLTALLDTLGGGPVVLSGHSMGGAAALLAAAERPARVKALALFDPVIIPSARPGAPGTAADNDLAEGARRRRAVFPSREIAMDSYRGRGPFKRWSEETLADYVQDGFRERPDGQVELTCSPAWETSNFVAHGFDPRPAMGRIDAPVVILKAEVGSTCRLSARDPFPPGNRRVRIETVPGTSHFLPMERPDLVRGTLLALVA